MSKKCAKCLKAVYPLEELKCLDKVWHKGCFKCEVCAMTLNMKNYKGYDKLPYCSAHYPKTTFTQVADTPEIRRIAENTRLQSNVQYHSEFEKSKDKYTVVADNPDIQRCLQNSKNVSLIQYHSEFEKGKSNYTVIADRPDVQCCLEASKNASLVQYHSDFERAKGSCISVPDTLEMKRHTKNTENTSLIKYHDDFEKSKGTYTAIPDSLDMKRSLENTKNISLIKYHEEFEKLKGKKTNVTNDPEMLRLTVNTRMQSNIAYKGLHNQLDKMEQKRPAQTASESFPGAQLPVQDHHHHHSNTAFDSPYSSKVQATTIFDSRTGRVENGSTRRIGSIADYDPLSEQYGSLVQGKDSTQQGAAAGRQAGAGDRGMVCRAIYDYTAADSDEVSFLEDDLIIRCNPIDVGWMDGTVERTGQTGMLPSNYVHKVEM